ncbi:putative eukaryotic translational release factor 1 [Zopfochytrium polystomum]|nr:putative eukaryotic translational release factor 1 [Zopfochytrium polystomum]
MANDDAVAVAAWKVKRLVAQLDEARGGGTSMISLVLPADGRIDAVNHMLVEEYGKAANIKSRVNRLSVLSALTSTQQRLKLYPKLPPNGLAIFSGTVELAEGKSKQLTISIEPFKPLKNYLYLCDSRFHTDALKALLTTDTEVGFIVVDGHGALFGTLAGDSRKVLQKLSVDLPKKHRRGGQSAQRFERLRDERRHNYVRKVAELATHHFIANDRVIVSGLVLAGYAAFKAELAQSDLLDPRLRAKVIKLVDVAYGGENGFNQAIELCQDVLENVKFVQEKKLITRYFDEVAQDSGKYCFGVEDTMHALQLGGVETLIVWEGLDVERYVFRRRSDGVEEVKYFAADVRKRDLIFESTGEEAEVAERVSLVEWLTEHSKDCGASLELVTDRSREGSQFAKGFGGIGGLLRYKIEFGSMEDESDVDYSSD